MQLLYKPFESKSHEALKSYLLREVDFGLASETMASRVFHLEAQRPTIQEILEPDIMTLFGEIHPIVIALAFVVPPASVYQQTIHVDANQMYGQTNALNYPIANCEKGEMRWYQGEYENVMAIMHPAGGRAVNYLKTVWHTEPQLVDTAIIDRPHIVKTDIPHQVLNLGEELRVMLSIRFRIDVPYIDQTPAAH